MAYCQTIVKLFQTLPTHTWLANAGITPSASQTYALSDIISALQQGSGGVSTCLQYGPCFEIVSVQYTPDIGCSNGGLNTISWYFNLQGSVIDGNFVPISEYIHILYQAAARSADDRLDSPGFTSSSCSSDGIQYLPKSG